MQRPRRTGATIAGTRPAAPYGTLARLLQLIVLASLPACGVLLGSCDTSSEQQAGFALPAGFASQQASDASTVLTIRDESSMRGTVYLDLPTIRALPSRTFTAYDPWLDRQRTRTGVHLAALLDALDLGVGADELLLRATNHYEVSVSLEQVREYDYLLAYEEDGVLYREQPLEFNKGPLAIAINYDRFPDLDVEVMKFHEVWWIDEIVVR